MVFPGEDNATEKNRKYRKHTYTFIKKVQERAEVNEWLAECNLVPLTTSQNSSCNIEYYRCGKVTKSKSVSCPVRGKVETPDDDVFFHLSYTTLNHEHATNTEKISIEFQKTITQLAKNNMKPFAILTYMKNNFEFNYNIEQVRYVIRKHEENSNEPVVSIGDLIAWAKSLRRTPVDDDTPFVIAFSHLNTKFNVIFSTIRLLSHAANDGISADSTYQTNWQGFPLNIVGGFDAMQKFHMIALSLASNETTDNFQFLFDAVKNSVLKFHNKEMKPTFLMSDAAFQISNGCLAAFSNSIPLTILMCFFHVAKAIEAYKFQKHSNKELIKSQIKVLQLCSNPTVFCHVVELFLTEWSASEPHFVAYFRKEWIDKHPNWFCAVNLKAPNTNNGIEGFNSNIKANFTLRRRLSLTQFKQTLLHLMESTSQMYVREKEKKVYYTEIVIRKEEWQTAVKFIQNPVSVSRVFLQNGIYYILSEGESNRKEQRVKNAEQAEGLFFSCAFSSFTEYVENYHQAVYQLKLTESYWMDSTCSCPYFMKNVTCKHVLAICMLKKLVKCPIEANPALLAKKPTRGRKANAKGALHREKG